MKRSNNINENISPEIRLMLAGARSDSARVQYLLSSPVNWGLFLRLAAYHQVYPLVYQTLSQLNNPAVPENVMISLRTQCRENSLRALNMTGETIRMVNCLESHGLRAVVLKGVALASHLYGNIAIRPSSDVDILVSPDVVELATKILEDEGYRETHPEYGLTPRQNQIYLRAYPHPHHLVFWHAERNIFLEIHWNLGHFGQVVLPMPTDTSIERIQVAGSSLPVLADEEWLLYLVSHGAGHAWFSFRWLVDIGKFMQRELDWEKLESLAKNLGMQFILHSALILANHLLETPLPPGYQSSVLADRRAERLSSLAISLCFACADQQLREPGSDFNNYWYFVYHYQMRVGWRNKVKYIFSLWRPAVSDIRLVSLPDPLYPLYYVIRPFTLFYWVLARSQKATAGRLGKSTERETAETDNPSGGSIGSSAYRKGHR
jgi:hypothetical protein